MFFKRYLKLSKLPRNNSRHHTLYSSVAFVQLALADVLLLGEGTRKAHFEDAAIPGLVRVARGGRRVRGQRGRALRRRHCHRRLRVGQLRSRGKLILYVR